MNVQDSTDRVRDLESRVDALTRRIRALQTEQELWVQSEKESAVGRLARGVAHEINNPLQGVLGFVQLLIHKLRDATLEPKQALQHLEWIETSALRCKRIVDALLDFSSRDDSASRVLDIVGLIELNVILLRHELEARDGTVTVEAPGGPIPVKANPAQLTQALYNVLANARDAVGRGGRVTVRAASRNGLATITVADSGAGIAPGDLPRIFDPFFSTKEVGEGTGLGLCAARGIFRLHGGDIRVTSDEDDGTVVVMQLPLHAAVPTDSGS